MMTRYASSTLMGSLVVFGLLYLMQNMIATGRGVMSPRLDGHLVDFVRVERTQTVETKDEKPPKPTEPAIPPNRTVTEGIDEFGPSLPVSFGLPPIERGNRTGLTGFGMSDGEYLPIVTVAPVYPERAITRNLEGHVTVEFTVTRTGSTRDIRIVESSHSIFERAAVDSAAKYRYRPRVINGEPVEVPGVQTLIRFVLEN